MSLYLQAASSLFCFFFSLDNDEHEITRRSSSGYSSDTETDNDVAYFDSLCSSPKSRTKLNSKRYKSKQKKFICHNDEVI
jgi:hypothetical protein